MPGEVGAPGERGAGDAGAKVSQNSSSAVNVCTFTALNVAVPNLSSGRAGINGAVWFAGSAGGGRGPRTEGSLNDRLLRQLSSFSDIKPTKLNVYVCHSRASRDLSV